MESGEFEKGVDKASQKLKGMELTVADAEKMFTDFAVKAGAVLLEIGKAAFGVGMDFEQAMANIKAVTGGTTEEIDFMAQASRDMSKEFGVSATDIARAFQFIAESGGDAQQMTDDMRGALLLATASGENFGMVTQFMATMMKVFGDETTDSEHIANVMAATISAANTNVGDLATAMQYMAPLASDLGYSIDDTAIAMAVMAENGLTGSMAGTSLQRVLMNMLDPTDKVADAMQLMGLSLVDANGEMKPLIQVMGEVQDAFQSGEVHISDYYQKLLSMTEAEREAYYESQNMNKSRRESTEEFVQFLLGAEKAEDGTIRLTEAQKAQTMATIGGSAGFKALSAIAGATAEDMEWLAETIYESGNAFGGMGQAAGASQTQLGTLQGKVDIFNSSLADVGISLYEYFKKPAEIAVGAATKVIQFFGENLEILMPIILGVAAAVAAFAIAINFASIIKGVTVAFVAFNAVLAANPIGAIIALVAGLAVGIAALISWLNRETEEQKALRLAVEAVSEAYGNQLDAINKSAASHNEKISAINNEARANKALVKEINDLYFSYIQTADVEAMTVEEKQRLSSMVDRLNKSMGETVMMYDAENHELVDLTGNIYDVINARKQELEIAARQERLLDLTKERIRLEDELAEAEQTRKTLLARGVEKESKLYQEIQEKISGYNNLLDINAGNYERNADIVDRHSIKVAEAHEKIADAAEKAAEQQMELMDDVERHMLATNTEQKRILDERTRAEEEYTTRLKEEANKRGVTLDDMLNIVGKNSMLIKELMDDELGHFLGVHLEQNTIRSDSAREDEIYTLKLMEEANKRGLTLDEMANAFGKNSQIVRDLMDDELGHFIDVKLEQNEILKDRARADEEYTLKLTEEANKQGLTLNEYKDRLKELEKAEKEEYEKRKKTLESYTNVATEMFKKINTKSNVSVKEMTTNLEHNQKAIETWSTNIVKLAERGLDEGLLQKLKDAGPESAGTVQALVNASDKELAKLSGVFANGSKVATDALMKQLGLDDVKNSGSKMVDDIAKGVDDNESLLNSAVSLIEEAQQATAAKVKESDFPGIGEEIVLGIIDGLESKSSALYGTVANMITKAKDAAAAAAEIRSPSRVFAKEIGKPIAEGVAKGIEDGAGSVSKASKNLAGYYIEGIAGILTKEQMNSLADTAIGYFIQQSEDYGYEAGQSGEQLGNFYVEGIRQEVSPEAMREAALVALDEFIAASEAREADAAKTGEVLGGYYIEGLSFQLSEEQMRNAATIAIDYFIGGAEAHNDEMGLAGENLGEFFIEGIGMVTEDALREIAQVALGEFIDGVDGEIPDVQDSGYKLGVTFADGIIEGIDMPTFVGEVGKAIADNIEKGIKQNSPKVAKAAEEMSKMTFKNAKLWIADYRNSIDYLVQEEIAMWQLLAKQYTELSKEKVEIENNITKLTKKLLDEQTKNEKESQKEKEKAAKDAQKERETALRAQEKAEKEFYENAKLLIADYKNSVDYTIEGEIAMWENLQKSYTELSNEKVEIDKTILKLREELRKEEDEAIKKHNEETFNFSKIWIEAQKELNLITAQEEIEAWERVSERYEKGTKQREEADKNLSKAREELRKAEMDAIKEMEKLETDYTKAVEDRAKALFNTFGMFSEATFTETNVDKNTKAVEDAQKAYDDLIATQSKLNDDSKKASATLNKAMADISKDAQKAYETLQDALNKISKEMASKSELTAEQQEKYRDQQAAAQKKYDETMDKLRDKQLSAEQKYLEDTNAIKDKQIETNIKLVGAQRDLTEATESAARSQAQVMIDNLTEQIDAMTSWADNMQALSDRGVNQALLEELRKMGPTANRYLEQLIDSSDEELTKLSELYQTKHELARNLAVDELQELRIETDEKISEILQDLTIKMSSDTNPIGQEMIQGIIDGVLDKSSELSATLAKVMQHAIDAATAAMGGQGLLPQTFADVGKFAGEGFVDGVKDIAEKADAVASNAFSGFNMSDLQQAVLQRDSQPALVAAGGSIPGLPRANPFPVTITNYNTIENDMDIDRVSRKLSEKIDREIRARGGGML